MSMQKVIGLIFACLMLAGCGKKEVRTPDIIPLPVSMTIGDDAVQWESGTVNLVAKTDDEKHVASLLQEFFTSKNITASVVETSEDENRIVLSTTTDETIPEEGYKLVIDKNGVTLQAKTGAGLFYGAQTL